MSGNTAYVISLKFAPGLKKEFMVLGDNIRKTGIKLKYLLSLEYAKLEGDYEGMEYITTSTGITSVILDTSRLFTAKKFMEIFSPNPPVFILLYNPHPLNPLIARLVKSEFPDAITALYLHDPYKPDKSHYGRTKGIYISIVELIQRRTLKYMDYVISPSEYSSKLLREYYPEFEGENYIAPLLVPDQGNISRKTRKYFSIVGGVHRATGHETFIELVNYVAESGIGYEFTLISSSDILKYLKNLANKGKEILRVINKSLIKDSEVNEVISNSYAVFRLDREVTQSGVIPVSYMNATPIIARDIPGLKQHIKHKHNGYLVPFDCTCDELIKAIKFIKVNFGELSENARKSYEEIWAEWNWDKYYGWLINLLRTENLS